MKLININIHLTFSNTQPSKNPTLTPSNSPTEKPTSDVSLIVIFPGYMMCELSTHIANLPSYHSFTQPSKSPSSPPTIQPTLAPSAMPSKRPTLSPITPEPSKRPSDSVSIIFQFLCILINLYTHAMSVYLSLILSHQRIQLSNLPTHRPWALLHLYQARVLLIWYELYAFFNSFTSTILSNTHLLSQQLLSLLKIRLKRLQTRPRKDLHLRYVILLITPD